MTIDWQPLCDIIEQHQRFVLSSHVRPDADALGSELAFANLLESIGKSVRVINPSAPPDNLKFLDPRGRAVKFGQNASADEVCDTDVHVVLDTSAWKQLDSVGRALKRSTAVKVLIDHHVSSDDLGAIEFKDTSSEATGALVFDFAQARGLSIDEESANLLYCAIATDTGWFRFPSTTAQTMRVIGQLIDLGAKPPVLYRQLYEQRSLARLRLASRILNRVTLDCDGRLAYTTVEWKDFEATGATPVDTEDMVNECLTIAGTQAAFIAVEQQNRIIKVSFRSRSELNVAAIAEKFGGGGHKQASGATLKGPLRDATQRILTQFQAAIEQAGS